MKLRDIVRMIPVAGALVMTAALVVSACGGSIGSSTKSLPPVTLNFKVVAPEEGLVGSDGNKHDTFFLLNPQTVRVGQAVTISIANYDDMPHSWTSPELSINLMIPPAPSEGTPSLTTYTFTPTKAGTFRWFCAVPCDTDTNGWAMQASTKGPDQDNYMAGYLTISE
jgi:heme/copper-type cytochrome/quinol oxidase subunit 2